MSTKRKVGLEITFDTDALRMARLRAGLTQEQVARELDITTRAYQRWEQGDGLPRPYTAARLAGLLNISTETLYIFAETVA